VFSFFFQFLSGVLAWLYSLTHSYGGAIILWTIVVLLILSPLTVKGTRSMLAMQKLAPELKKLQELHKNDRQKLNEEVQRVYRDNNITPWGGCLPLLIQMPVLIIFYRVISGLIHHNSKGVPTPKYISHSSSLYHDIVSSHGHLKSFGIDLAQSAKTHHATFAKALPFYILIVVMVAVQYWQQWQMTSRAPAADTPQAQQMRSMQKIFPLFFAFISFNIPAGVVLYWITSSLFRVLQQFLMYRFDPLLKTTVESATKETEDLIKRDKTQSGRAQKAPGRPNNNKKKRKGR
jgi:YidC/Oxa1 family membrane protein insertase